MTSTTIPDSGDCTTEKQELEISNTELIQTTTYDGSAAFITAKIWCGHF